MHTAGQQVLFDPSSSEASKSPFQSYRGDKPRMSYGGGFHMSKKPAPAPQPYVAETSKPIEIGHRFSSDPTIPPLHVIERELERLREHSTSIEKLRSNHFTAGILHLDPPSHRNHSHEKEFSLNQKISLEELELLKEKNAARIVEIQAELRRSQTNEVLNHSAEFIEVYKPRKPEVKKPEKLTEYQKQYYENFESYMNAKDKAKADRIIEAKIASENQGVLESARGRKEEFDEHEFKWTKTEKGKKEKRDKSPVRNETHSKRHKESKSILKSSSSVKSLKLEKEHQPTCLIPYKHMAKLEEVFLNLDTHQDYVVPRGELVTCMMENEAIIKILHIDAVRVSNYQVLDLESMLTYIKNDGDDPDELITWNQFLDYFFILPTFEESKFEGMENPRLYDIDLPSRFVTLIQEVFEDLDKKSHNKVSTYEFIQGVKNDSKTSALISYTARIPEGLSHIPEETVGEVLSRIEETADSLISWSDVLGFFSKRGLPRDSMIGESLITRNSFVKAKKPPKPVKENFVQTEDLEPKKHSHRSRSASPRQRVTFYEKEIKKDVTIPAPFKFEDRENHKSKSIREKWLERDCEERERELQKHINFKYQAKDVPREVSQPKYEKLKRALEERSAQVKRESAEKTRQLEKPFDFYLRDKERTEQQKNKIPSPKDEYKFKANPIPWACTVSLYESKIKEEEALREERKSRAAQENLRKASLPPRMEMYQHMKKAEIPENKTPSPKFKVKDPPNFKKLQDRFEKTLEAKKSAKKNTLVEPFLIDQRVEESKKRKEENKKKREEEEAKKKLEEEKKRKQDEEKMRNERIKAKENWKSDHELMRMKGTKPVRKSSKSRSRESTPESHSFTRKDLKKDSITMNVLKPSPSKTGKVGQSSLNQTPKSSQGKRAASQTTKPSLAPPTSSKPGDFTAKDLNTSSSNPLAPPSSNPLAPSSSNPLAPDSKKASSAFPPFAKPSDKANPLAPPEKSNRPSSSKNPLAPSDSSSSKTGNDRSSNPLAPTHSDKNPLAPDHGSKNPLAPDSTSKNPLAPDSSSANPLAPNSSSGEFSLPGARYNDLVPIPEENSKNPLAKPATPAKGGSRSNKNITSSDLKPPSETSKNLSGKKYDTINPLKKIISAEEQQLAADKGQINERLRKRKEESKKQEQEYQEKLKMMKENVNKRPLLVESATDSSNKNRSKMKILLSIKKNLEDSGVKFEPYFTEEELALIQEAEYMSKMNRLK